MRLAKVALVNGDRRVAIIKDEGVQLLDLSQVEQCRGLMDILHAPDPLGLARYLFDRETKPIPISEVKFLAPLDKQEVWAAGVTYKRSQVARMEESESGASHYDKVYTAARPELFFKASAWRVVDPETPLRVRADSKWSVPEPELALVVTPELKLAGFSIGNDMSARDIEGENPLYLPQAKVYDQCCSIGPCVLVPEQPLDRQNTKIVVTIVRNGESVFTGETNLGEMVRGFEDLIGWLGKEYSLPDGAFLLTGTGVVPPDDFTLLNGDSVSIEISGIGTLTNPIVQG